MKKITNPLHALLNINITKLTSSKLIPTYINIVGYNIIWLGLVMLGNVFIPIALLLLIAHLKCLSSRHEIVFIFIFTFLGSLIDSLLSINEIFIFSHNEVLPLWLFILWMCFSATINHSLAFLNHRYLTQFFIGGTLGPLSYLAGHHLGAVNFSNSLHITLVILSVIWAPLFMLSFRLNNFIANYRLQTPCKKDLHTKGYSDAK